MMIGLRYLLARRLHVLSRAGRFATKLAIVGANARASRLLEDTAQDAGFLAVGVFDDRLPRWANKAGGGLRRGSIADLVEFARTNVVDAVVITLPSGDGDLVDEVRDRLRGLAADIYLCVDAEPARGVRLAGHSVLRLSARPLDDRAAFRKMVFDRVVSALLLVVALPLLAVIAVLVKIDSPGPVLFRQPREGLNGSTFVMLKFRTMHCGSRREELQATRRDRRVTRVGRWLRRFSLDELPQLLNVLAGTMSLVGPRPHLATTRVGNLLLKEVVPDYKARQRMQPGMTGWAQVRGPARGDPDRRGGGRPRRPRPVLHRQLVAAVRPEDHRRDPHAGDLQPQRQGVLRPPGYRTRRVIVAPTLHSGRGHPSCR